MKSHADAPEKFSAALNYNNKARGKKGNIKWWEKDDIGTQRHLEDVERWRECKERIKEKERKGESVSGRLRKECENLKDVAMGVKSRHWWWVSNEGRAVKTKMYLRWLKSEASEN